MINYNIYIIYIQCKQGQNRGVTCLLPCSHISEESEYENEDKYNLEHDTSDEDSVMSEKDVEEESWTFMENLVYEENDELETFDGFVDFPIYGIS